MRKTVGEGTVKANFKDAPGYKGYQKIYFKAGKRLNKDKLM